MKERLIYLLDPFSPSVESMAGGDGEESLNY